MLLVKRRKTARTPLAAMEAARLSQPVAGAASLIRRSRPSPDHPNPSAAPSRGARFVGAPQAAGIVLPPRPPPPLLRPFTRPLPGRPPGQNSLRKMICDALLTDWVHLAVLAQLWAPEIWLFLVSDVWCFVFSIFRRNDSLDMDSLP
ncbi:uncharacterized protein LOC120682399 [Panicum virgatum]|uniref:Uncharacterized protein n=1 Tax=Panicum virgatum TaxID=38727 RepID=A0A8T0PTJ4_PANVG|nr:uncharacterized protein LOC120682399 [Panicum virgatum]KAG2565000.1 hypothetical protein PVAP13_7NG004156 [Panicum virgatum]